MTKSSLKERFAQRGLVRAADRVSSGSPVTLSLALDPDAKMQSVLAIQILVRHGMTLVRAKRAIETVMQGETALVRVPMIDDLVAFVSALRGFGVRAVSVARRTVDLKALRERLKLSQEQFALTYGLELDAVQNWEQGRRPLDGAILSYLRVIERAPEQASVAQWDAS